MDSLYFIWYMLVYSLIIILVLIVSTNYKMHYILYAFSNIQLYYKYYHWYVLFNFKYIQMLASLTVTDTTNTGTEY